MKIVIIFLTVVLSGCTTTQVWVGDNSPTKKECVKNKKYLYGSNLALLYMAEAGEYYRLIDVPFSFVADVVLLPAAIPLTNRNYDLCNTSE